MTHFAAQQQVPLGLFPNRPAPHLYDRVIEVLRVHHYSRRTKPLGSRLSTLDSRLVNDIRTVQDLLSHNDVKTTMIYTHVLGHGPGGVAARSMDFEVHLLSPAWRKVNWVARVACPPV